MGKQLLKAVFVPGLGVMLAPRLVKNPQALLQLMAEFREQKIVNGMGSYGFGWLIPDRFHGVDLSFIGDWHDVMWYFGYIEAGNMAFKDNLFTAIRFAFAEKPIQRTLLYIRAWLYVAAVVYIGTPIYAFYRRGKGLPVNGRKAR